MVDLNYFDKIVLTKADGTESGPRRILGFSCNNEDPARCTLIRLHLRHEADHDIDVNVNDSCTFDNMFSNVDRFVVTSLTYTDDVADLKVRHQPHH